MIKKPHIVFVVGMHSSGTSLATKALETLGISLGSGLDKATAWFNKDGFFESIAARQINESVLDTLGFSWDSIGLLQLTKKDLLILEKHQHAAKKLINENIHRFGIWGFKDPRTARLLPFWQNVLDELGINRSYVVCIRSPSNVALSLRRRDGFPLEKSVALWITHYAGIISSIDNNSCIVLDYDKLVCQPRIELDRIIDTFGLKDLTSKDKVDEFCLSFVKKGSQHFINSEEDNNDIQHLEYYFPLAYKMYHQLSDFSHRYAIEKNEWNAFSENLAGLEFLQQAMPFIDSSEQLARKAKITNHSVQIYIDSGNGFDEESSTHIKESDSEPGQYVITLSNFGVIHSVRIDPGTKPCILFIKGVFTTHINNRSIEISELHTNAIYSKNNLHVFDTSDPNIVFSPNSLLKKLRINLFYLATGVNTEPYIASVRRHQLESSLCSIDPSLRLDQITEPLTIDDHLKLEPSPQSSITFNSIERLKETFGRMQTEIECLRSNAQKHDSEIQYLRAQCSSLLKERDKFTEHLDLLFERSDALISRSLSKRLNESEAIFAAAEISLPTKHGEPSEQPSPPTTLFVSHNASRTGAPICLIDFISWLKSNTTMKFKIILKEGGPITTRFQQLGECFFFDDEWNNRHDESTFRQRLIEFCPNADLIYANTIASFDVLEHLKYLDAPLLTHVHELESVIQEFVGEKFIELEQFTDYFLCASPAVRENLKHHHNIADVNSGTLYSPIAVDTNYDGNNKEKLRISLGLDPSLTYVVSCGTIEWRKGPDLFVECAKILADRGLKDIQFLWIGEFFDNEYSNLDKELSLTNLGDMVKFLGLRDNARDYFAACDIFLLPSREDPFPLVCLEAAEKQLPILCFADAGSMPDFVEKDAGYFVPYEDTEALASCIQNLAENVNLRTQLGKRARQKILERHDVEKATPHLLRVMHWVAHIHPKVSVIVPNYNHADYLIERLDSIFSQTYRNFEVIILDDCSSDDSIKLIERYVKHPLVRMVKNPHNSGNVFVQWLQGLRLARGELIWIAESDDFCKNNFLERLVPVFSDPSMALAYCQSLPVDAQGRHAGEFDYLSYTKDLSESKWTANYCCTGIEEVNHGLAVKNTIPNVSAVLSRKPNINRLEKDIVQFTVSGDWYYYLNLLTNGKITFIADTLNFHRRHSHSVVAQHEASTIHFSDISRIHRFILDNFSISNYTKKRMLQQVKNEWMRHHQDSNFDELLVSYSKEVYDELTGADRDSISILIVVSDLNFGGGQIAAIRLANALLKAKHRIYLLNVGAHAEEKQVRNMLSPEITVFSTNEWTSPMADFRSLIVENEIQVINSHIWWADKFVATHLGELETAWVITMHGCYEHLLHDELCDPEFTSLAPQLLDRADSIIYIADKNLEVFDHFSLSNPDKLKKVYTGFEPQTPRAINKNELGIDEGSFIAGIVSRAIPEKGWEQAIKAIELLNADLPNPIHLILIGESEYSQTLAARHHNSKNIHFIGFTESPLNYIQLFDVGLLPTYFDSESLPNSVVEYLACDKPVIATAMGEIKNMIMTKKGIAGQIVNFDLQGKADTKQLVKLIEKYVKNPDYLSTHSLLAKTAFEKFSMQNCIEKYSGVFQTLIASKNPHS